MESLRWDRIIDEQSHLSSNVRTLGFVGVPFSAVVIVVTLTTLALVYYSLSAIRLATSNGSAGLVRWCEKPALEDLLRSAASP